jgi:hypothetical protein
MLLHFEVFLSDVENRSSRETIRALALREGYNRLATSIGNRFKEIIQGSERFGFQAVLGTRTLVGRRIATSS